MASKIQVPGARGSLGVKRAVRGSSSTIDIQTKAAGGRALGNLGGAIVGLLAQAAQAQAASRAQTRVAAFQKGKADEINNASTAEEAMNLMLEAQAGWAGKYAEIAQDEGKNLLFKDDYNKTMLGSFQRTSIDFDDRIAKAATAKSNFLFSQNLREAELVAREGASKIAGPYEESQSIATAREMIEKHRFARGEAATAKSHETLDGVVKDIKGAAFANDFDRKVGELGLEKAVAWARDTGRSKAYGLTEEETDQLLHIQEDKATAAKVKAKEQLTTLQGEREQQVVDSMMVEDFPKALEDLKASRGILDPPKFKKLYDEITAESDRMAEEQVLTDTQTAMAAGDTELAKETLESPHVEAGVQKEWSTAIRAIESADNIATEKLQKAEEAAKEAATTAAEEKDLAAVGVAMRAGNIDLASTLLEDSQNIPAETKRIWDSAISAKIEAVRIASERLVSGAIPLESDFDAVDRVKKAIDAYGMGAVLSQVGDITIKADREYARVILAANKQYLNKGDREQYTNELYAEQDSIYSSRRSDGRFHLKAGLLTGTNLFGVTVAAPGSKEKTQYQQASTLLDIQLDAWKKSGSWPSPPEFYQNVQSIITKVKEEGYTLPSVAAPTVAKTPYGRSYEAMNQTQRGIADELRAGGKTEAEVLEMFNAR